MYPVYAYSLCLDVIFLPIELFVIPRPGKKQCVSMGQKFGIEPRYFTVF